MPNGLGLVSFREPTDLAYRPSTCRVCTARVSLELQRAGAGEYVQHVPARLG